MIYATNLLTLPMVILVWALDSYLFVSMLRLIYGRIIRQPANPFYLGLQSLTDGPPSFVEEWVKNRTRCEVPRWLPWVVVLTAAVVLRNLFVLVVAFGA